MEVSVGCVTSRLYQPMIFLTSHNHKGLLPLEKQASALHPKALFHRNAVRMLPLLTDLPIWLKGGSDTTVA